MRRNAGTTVFLTAVSPAAFWLWAAGGWAWCFARKAGVAMPLSGSRAMPAGTAPSWNCSGAEWTLLST